MNELDFNKNPTGSNPSFVSGSLTMSEYLTHCLGKLNFAVAPGRGALRCAPLDYETAASKRSRLGKFQTYSVLSPTVNRILLIPGHASFHRRVSPLLIPGSPGSR